MKTSTFNHIADALTELLTPTLTLAGKTLAKNCLSIPTKENEILTGYMETLHLYDTTRHGKKDLRPREQSAAARKLYLLADRLKEYEPRLTSAANALRDLLY